MKKRVTGVAAIIKEIERLRRLEDKAIASTIAASARVKKYRSSRQYYEQRLAEVTRPAPTAAESHLESPEQQGSRPNRSIVVQ